MTNQNDIAQIILLMQAAFSNYHPGERTPEALYQFLQDLPSDTIEAAVLATCAQAGRAFAPTVGEIREAALKLSTRAQGIPSEFEAWGEVCRMPKNMVRSQVLIDGEGKMVTNESGAVIIQVEKLTWSHALVERTASLMGWPEFPGEDESLDRAHFFQAYCAAVSRMMEDAGELPAVRNYVEGRSREGRLSPQLRSGDATRTIGQVIKALTVKDAP